MKKNKVTPISPALKEQADRIFRGKQSGAQGIAPLKHKNDAPLSDIEYFYLLGEIATQMDAENKTNLPTDYGKYDRDCVKVAKMVKEAKDAGTKDEEIQYFLDLCIDVNK